MRELMSPAEVAETIRSTTSTLAYWRHVGRGPKYAKIGRRVVYRRDDIHQWVNEQFAKDDQR